MNLRIAAAERGAGRLGAHDDSVRRERGLLESRERARGLREAAIVTATGRVELVARQVAWIWSVGHEADHDLLTVLAPRDQGLLALPLPYLENWSEGARALALFDHYGRLAARWARGDLMVAGLPLWNAEGRATHWEILDAALAAGTSVEWRDGSLAAPHLEWSR